MAEDIREKVEKVICSELGKIQNMSDVEAKVKAINAVTNLYSEYNKDWKDQMEIQMQMDRREYENEKLKLDVERLEFEKSQASQNIKQAKRESGVKLVGIGAGLIELLMKLYAIDYEVRMDYTFQNEGKLTKGAERTMAKYKLL